MAAELRAIARDDERANRDERRLLNRLRADLIATFPAALRIAGDDMGKPTFLRLLERWPTHEALRQVPREEIEAFARAGHHGWLDRFADQISAALVSETMRSVRPRSSTTAASQSGVEGHPSEIRR